MHPHDAAKATPETFERLAQLAERIQSVWRSAKSASTIITISRRAKSSANVFIAATANSRARRAKPIVIHTREAWDDTLALLREQRLALGGIMHCFTGGAKEAEKPSIWAFTSASAES